jgi:hypothetical protein
MFVYVQMRKLTIFSDGPASQFKNRYMVHLLAHLRLKFALDEISWNFFASGHGKGPVDGVGGTVKRLAASAVMRRKAIIMCAVQFCAVVCNSTTSIHALAVNDTTSILEKYGVCAVFATAPRVSVHLHYLFYLQICEVTLCTTTCRHQEYKANMLGGAHIVACSVV